MSETLRGILSAFVIVACLALIGYLVHEKVDGAAVLAVSTVTILVAYFTRQPPKNDPPGGAVAAVGVAIMLGLSIIACRPLTPDEKTATKSGCETLVAFAGSGREQALCAFAPEIADLVSSIRAQRADAGTDAKVARMRVASGECQIVGTVCATDDELARAMVAVTDSRGAR